MNTEKRHRTFRQEISLLRAAGLRDSLIYLSRQMNQKVLKECLWSIKIKTWFCSCWDQKKNPWSEYTLPCF